MPKVSVIITSFDAGRFLAESVGSVLRQTERDLECLVVDDASTDDTPAVLASFDDPRLTVLRNETNLGPFASANRGLSRATGAFVARLDADDVCVPHRLERQLGFFAAHPAVGLLGSACERVDEAGEPLGHQPVPESDLAIRLRCLVAPPFLHSSVMWRRSLGLVYDASMRLAGDYELWTRALEQAHAANLTDALVRYRVWSGGLSARHTHEQQRLHDELAARFCLRQWPSLDLDAEGVRLLRAWSASGARGPLPRPARVLVAALQSAVLGATPSPEALETFARSVFSAPGQYGQPAPTA